MTEYRACVECGGSVEVNELPHSDAVRAHVAWLLWCAKEGYILAENRAVLSSPNMFEIDPSTLHPDDQRDLPGWLDMADSVLAAIDAELPSVGLGLGESQ